MWRGIALSLCADPYSTSAQTPKVIPARAAADVDDVEENKTKEDKKKEDKKKEKKEDKKENKKEEGKEKMVAPRLRRANETAVETTSTQQIGNGKHIHRTPTNPVPAPAVLPERQMTSDVKIKVSDVPERDRAIIWLG